MTPFAADILWSLSLGDGRLCGLAFGPWGISYHPNTISLDGRPVELHSWEHAEALVAGRPDAERWTKILREEVHYRRELRLQHYPESIS